MQRIDAHQHFWKYDPVRDSWITEDMAVIQNDFLPEAVAGDLQENSVVGCVAVQADQSEAENAFLLNLADRHAFIKGVVGWVDLQAENVGERLAYYSGFAKMKGFRHILQGEPQRDLMLQPAFKRGIRALQSYQFSYDLLIYPDQLPFAKELVAEFSEQRFVIDHLAKPPIKAKELKAWKKDIEAVAQWQNVSCKLSGMVTEADWKAWQKEDFRPYMDVAVNAFGTERILFGSDWPVCLVAATYSEVVAIVSEYFSSFSIDEQQKVFGGNATRFYQL